MDVDWDEDVLPAPHCDSDDAACDSDDAALSPRARQSSSSREAIVVARQASSSNVRKSRWKVFIPPPSRRTAAEGFLAAARMRDAKARSRMGILF